MTESAEADLLSGAPAHHRLTNHIPSSGGTIDSFPKPKTGRLPVLGFVQLGGADLMRVKFVSAVLLAAAVILGAALYLKEHLKQVTTLGSSKRLDSPLADSNSLSPLAPAEASATALTAA